MQCPEKEADYLFYNVGKETRANDFVFFISHSVLRRVLAVYKVTKKSLWHPYEKNQALLELVHRFDRSVTLSGETGERLGILELSASASTSWLDELEEIVPLRDKLKLPQEKVRPWQLRRAS